jgi:hypothetical protein
VLAVLLIVFGAAVAGLLATRIDQRVPVLVARSEIGVGQQISRDDLAIAEVASSGLTTIPVAQTAQVIGKYATEAIAPGRLIDGSMLGTSGLLVPGKAAVGIALAQGRYPASGLKTGDVVQVVRTVEGKATLITADAVVGTVQSPGSNVFGSSTSSNNTIVTIVVSDQQSPTIAAAAAASQLSLVLLRRGAVLGGG